MYQLLAHLNILFTFPGSYGGSNTAGSCRGRGECDSGFELTCFLVLMSEDMFPCFDVRSDCSFKTGLINTSVLSMGLCMSVDKVGEVTLQKQTADTYSHSNFEKFVHFLSVFRHLHLRIQAGIVRTSTSMQVVSIPFFICLWCTSASIAISSTTEVC